MKFLKLASRGGDYLVVVENVAWLRSAENGQTNVGIIGGQPLLVVGSIEEVAAKILAGSAPEDSPTTATAVESVPHPAPIAPEPKQQPAAVPPATTPHEVPPQTQVTAPAPAPEPKPLPKAEPVVQPASEASTPDPKPNLARPGVRPGPARPQSQWERPAASPQPSSFQVKAGSQRMMGRFG